MSQHEALRLASKYTQISRFSPAQPYVLSSFGLTLPRFLLLPIAKPWFHLVLFSSRSHVVFWSMWKSDWRKPLDWWFEWVLKRIDMPLARWLSQVMLLLVFNKETLPPQSWEDKLLPSHGREERLRDSQGFKILRFIWVHLDASLRVSGFHSFWINALTFFMRNMASL
jgi:hypothetical protein